MTKYVKRANLWCVTEFTTDPKSKKVRQTIHWFDTKEDGDNFTKVSGEKAAQAPTPANP